MSSSSRLLHLCMLAGIVMMAHGHGRLWDPPARTTAWRHGSKYPGAPVDYNDNELYCGGRQVQWEQNNGECGVCGDNIKDTVKQHEFGPQSMVKNILIVGTYKAGQVIDVTVEITANHRGYFEFRLCVRDDHLTTELTHDCLNQNLLRDVSTNKTQREIGTDKGRYVTSLQLPPGVTCKECVLQWKYNTGNDWGICSDGIGRLGCSLTPEQFYGCADISITDEGESNGGNNGKGGAGSNGNGNGNGNGGSGSNGNGNSGSGSNGNGNGGAGSNGNGNGGAGSNGNGNAGAGSNGNGNGRPGSNGNGDGGAGSNGNGNGNGGAGSNGNGNGGAGSNGNGNDDSTTSPTTSTTQSITTTTGPITNGDDESGSGGCRPTAVYASAPGMKNWCLINCLRGYCPSSHCSPECQRIPEPVSSNVCQPTLTYRRQPGMTNWCIENCRRGYCPSTHCTPGCQRAPEPVSSNECQPTLTYRSQPGMANWCLDNCPGRNCPSTHCNDACREP